MKTFAWPALAALFLILLIGVIVTLIGPAPADASAPTLAEARQLHRDGQWEPAAAAYDQFLALNPYHGGAWARLGDARYALQEYDAAIAAYTKAFELGEFPAVTAYNAACCFALVERAEEALDWLEKAIDAGYSDFDHMNRDTDLAKVRTKLRFRTMTGTHLPENVTRDEGWRHDLRSLVVQLEKRHWDMEHVTPRAELDAAVASLDARIPELQDHEVVVELKRIIARIGDGHTNLWYPGQRFHAHPGGDEPRVAAFHRYPMRLYRFRDGWFVESAAPEYAGTVGKRVISIDGAAIDDVYRRVGEVVSRDNDMTVLSSAPTPMTCPEVLAALGILPEPGNAGFILEGEDGPEAAVFQPGPWSQDRSGWVTMRDGASAPPPPYLRNEDDWHWFELQNDGTLYVKFGVVRDQEGDETVAEFSRRLSAWLEDNDPARVALDIRMNGGGNNFLNRPLVHALLRSRYNERGKLFTIIGRRTFSAAMNLASDLDYHTETLFVGEPTGSSPNFVGETSLTTLPWSGLRMSVSTLYWQNSYAQDRRTWIPPDLVAEVTSSDYRNHRDPAMEVIAAYREPAGS